MTFSIAAGIGFGVLGYVLVDARRGPRARRPPADVARGALFVAFFAADWLSANVF